MRTAKPTLVYTPEEIRKKLNPKFYQERDNFIDFPLAPIDLTSTKNSIGRAHIHPQKKQDRKSSGYARYKLQKAKISKDHMRFAYNPNTEKLKIVSRGTNPIHVFIYPDYTHHKLEPHMGFVHLGDGDIVCLTLSLFLFTFKIRSELKAAQFLKKFPGRKKSNQTSTITPQDDETVFQPAGLIEKRKSKAEIRKRLDEFIESSMDEDEATSDSEIEDSETSEATTEPGDRSVSEISDFSVSAVTYRADDALLKEFQGLLERIEKLEETNKSQAMTILQLGAVVKNLTERIDKLEKKK